MGFSPCATHLKSSVSRFVHTHTYFDCSFSKDARAVCMNVYQKRRPTIWTKLPMWNQREKREALCDGGDVSVRKITLVLVHNVNLIFWLRRRRRRRCCRLWLLPPSSRRHTRICASTAYVYSIYIIYDCWCMWCMCLTYELRVRARAVFVWHARARCAVRVFVYGGVSLACGVYKTGRAGTRSAGSCACKSALGTWHDVWNNNKQNHVRSRQQQQQNRQQAAQHTVTHTHSTLCVAASASARSAIFNINNIYIVCGLRLLDIHIHTYLVYTYLRVLYEHVCVCMLCKCDGKNFQIERTARVHSGLWRCDRASTLQTLRRVRNTRTHIAQSAQQV